MRIYNGERGRGRAGGREGGRERLKVQYEFFISNRGEKRKRK
jgi:hypothetical protein